MWIRNCYFYPNAFSLWQINKATLNPLRLKSNQMVLPRNVPSACFQFSVSHKFPVGILMQTHTHFASIIADLCVNLDLIERWNVGITWFLHLIESNEALLYMNYDCIIIPKPRNKPQNLQMSFKALRLNVIWKLVSMHLYWIFIWKATRFMYFTF